jgi:lipopolysaccharide export system permease protein
MTTFDLHIVRRFVSGFVYLVVTLIVFFIVLHYVEYIDDFMDRGAVMREVFLVYYPSLIPDIVRLTSPLALFLACVYLTGRLAQEMQLVALHTTGVSLYRLLRPFVGVALVVTAGMFWFNGYVVPGANRTVLDFEQQYLKSAPRQFDITDIHRQNRPGSIVTVGYYDQSSRVAHRVSLQEFQDAATLILRIDATRLEWVDSTGAWRIHDGVIRTFEPSGTEHRRPVESLDTTLNVFPRDFARTERDVESMTIPAAAEYVEALRRSGVPNIGRTLVGYYSKFAYPFANLILVLIGVPLAAVRRRGGQAVRIGMGLLTAFLYLAVMKLIEPFGYSGTLPATVTAWLPHILFLLLGLILIASARK